MTGAISEHSWEDLYPSGVCQLSGLIKSVLDQQMICLPSKAVSDEETRYPVDEPSMRAFLETFFTRHLFQLQRSLAQYIASTDFQKAMQFGPLRILVVQDKFQESLIRSLAHLLNVECQEQTVTQEVYPPRGDNETYTYTYYDCLYAPRERSIQRAWRVV